MFRIKWDGANRVECLQLDLALQVDSRKIAGCAVGFSHFLSLWIPCVLFSALRSLTGEVMCRPRGSLPCFWFPPTHNKGLTSYFETCLLQKTWNKEHGYFCSMCLLSSVPLQSGVSIRRWRLLTSREIGCVLVLEDPSSEWVGVHTHHLRPARPSGQWAL